MVPQLVSDSFQLSHAKFSPYPPFGLGDQRDRVVIEVLKLFLNAIKRVKHEDAA